VHAQFIPFLHSSLGSFLFPSFSKLSFIPAVILGSRIVIRPDHQPSPENGLHISHFLTVSPKFSGIGGAGVVAIYKLGFPELSGKGSGSQQFKSDIIFEEIKERAAQVNKWPKGNEYNIDVTAYLRRRIWQRKLGPATNL
jgi:hypothetical protein